VVTVPQAPQRNFGNSQCTFSSRTGGISHTCPHPRPAGSAPASPAPHDRHSAGGSAFSARSGSRAGSSPAPRWPGCPPGLRLGDRSRSDARRAALWRALAASGSLDGGEGGITAVHPQAALQSGDPQPQPPDHLSLARLPSLQRRDLGVPGPHHRPQPGTGRTQRGHLIPEGRWITWHKPPLITTRST
jgi:hypothetical protein